MWTFIKWVLGAVLKTLVRVVLAMVLVGLVAATVVYKDYQIIQYKLRNAVTVESVQQVLASETTVYYRGESEKGEPGARLGLLFAENHRRYVQYNQIPRPCIDALVSAEDQNYWQHTGIDVLGMAAAMRRNVQLRSFRYGGSSLPQQLVENLIPPSGRYRGTYVGRELAKLREELETKYSETLYALFLDSKFSKEQMLEWYFNQFYVRGEGVGLEVAAQYYFRKPVHELGALECAFIAGSVKGPDNYNPFIGEEEDRRERKRWKKAHERMAYVLGRMAEEGYISSVEAQGLIASEIPFAEEPGQFWTDSTVLLDEVAKAVRSGPIATALRQVGIENPATAGLTIITTIEQDVQEAAQVALTSHLTAMEANLRPAHNGAPVQGAVLVLSHDGRVVAMVGGRDNKDLNRVNRPAQPGSIMKAFVYFVARSLGWRPEDLIANQIQGFTWSDYGEEVQWYWPAKAHESGGVVAMTEALGRSENVAAIYTWDNLTLHMSANQMREMAARMGMAPTSEEEGDLRKYKRRIQDNYGVYAHASGHTVKEFVFRQAKHRVAERLRGEGNGEEAGVLVQLPYGGDFYVAEAGVQAGSDEKARFLRTTFLGLEAEKQSPGTAPSTESSGGDTSAGPGEAGGAPPVPLDTATIIAQLRAELAAKAEAAKGRMVGGSGISEATLTAVREEMVAILVTASSVDVLSLDPYEFDRLVWDQEFRRAASWRYAVALANRMGVQSHLEPVSSFPLGANVITPLEVARLYQAMTTGEVENVGQGSGNTGTDADTGIGTALISEIRNSAGQVIWQAAPQRQLLFDTRLAAVSVELLLAPFEHELGTARSQQAAVVVDGMRVPLGGKTGTTNKGAALSFCGFVPGVKAFGSYDVASLEDSRTFVVNIRHDDNSPVEKLRGGYYSSSEALKVWGAIAPAVAQSILDEDPAKRRTVGGEPSGGTLPLVLPDGTFLGQLEGQIEEESGTAEAGQQAGPEDRLFTLLVDMRTSQ